MGIPYTHLDKLYIDGRWAKTPTHEAVLNPATEAIIGQAPVGDTEATDAAIAAARSAFDRGPWPNLTMAERADFLRRMHSALDAKRDRLRDLIVAEVGCSQGITDALQISSPLEHLQRTIECASRDETYQLPLETTVDGMNPAGPRILGGGTVVREPVGVVAGITGYNFPLLINLAKIVPALLAGNTLVLKPSPFTPYSALLFGEIADEIGLPKGVLNIITGGADVGSLLSSHADIDMVSFTGSEGVGIAIMKQAAETLKRVHLELGGKSAMIVRHDADITQAAIAAVGGLTVNCGQGCALLTRFIVHNSVREQFVQTAKAVAAQIKIGDPADASVMMGPLIRDAQRAKVEGLIARGRDEGAKLICGGQRPAHLSRGYFAEIALFDDVDNAMTIAQEEVFGPVGVTIGFDSDDEAIALSNASRFGLNGGVVSADAATAYEMSLKLRTGSVYVNGGMGKMPFAPIGGYKRSGIGREYGADWLREYQQEKSIFYPVGR